MPLKASLQYQVNQIFISVKLSLDISVSFIFLILVRKLFELVFQDFIYLLPSVRGKVCDSGVEPPSQNMMKNPVELGFLGFKSEDGECQTVGASSTLHQPWLLVPTPPPAHPSDFEFELWTEVAL